MSKISSINKEFNIAQISQTFMNQIQNSNKQMNINTQNNDNSPTKCPISRPISFSNDCFQNSYENNQRKGSDKIHINYEVNTKIEQIIIEPMSPNQKKKGENINIKKNYQSIRKTSKIFEHQVIKMRIDQQSNQSQDNQTSNMQKYRQLRKNCQQGNLKKIFATFAPQQQQEEQNLPYFQQKSPKIKSPIRKQSSKNSHNSHENNSDKLVNSYRSNFQNFQIQQNDQIYKVEYKQKQLNKNQTTKQTLSQSIQIVNQQPKIPQPKNQQHKGKMMQAEGKLKVNKNKWQYIIYRISQTLLSIEDVPIEIKSIQKIKIFPVGIQLAKYNTLKISVKNVKNLGNQGQELFIGVKKNIRWAEFPLPYYTFIKIVIKKLKLFGIKNVTEWDAPDQRVRGVTTVRKQHTTMKYDQKQRQKSKSIDKSIDEQQRSPSSKLVVNAQKYNFATTFIHGKVYKKSKFFGKWQKRYTIINENGIFSFRDESDPDASIKMERKNIKYMWTWFSILIQQRKKVGTNQYISENIKNQQEYRVTQFSEKQILDRISNHQYSKIDCEDTKKYLIIKIKHGFSEQTEFAIPICNFDVAAAKNKNWLLAFYKVLPNLDKK